ncbi:hypothetical protein E2C01_033514 [Portunus trituberculatus]|uniref:Uncharacterized protein n=1 Tax=Portunus trituberculatus TaxID=210409 RepID=A0A5B7EYV6_PORTR|nr:hypothetical protein [Portunus trituberculatus]
MCAAPTLRASPLVGWSSARRGPAWFSPNPHPGMTNVDKCSLRQAFGELSGECPSYLSVAATVLALPLNGWLPRPRVLPHPPRSFIEN